MLRADLALVADLVPRGARVLDLGCGSGELLDHLITLKGCSGTGVDTDEAEVVQAIRRGVPVIELDVDAELGEFATDSYDTVVLSRTLQTLLHPRRVLDEMSRIGGRCIVSVPNFGLWRNRLAIVRGHMPISKDLPHTWHDSPNVRYTTLADLEDFFADAGFVVEQRIPLDEAGRVLGGRRGRHPNLFAGAAVYVLARPQHGEPPVC
ncbi:methionine biosynthesis protein MetW [Mariniluteicoccus flavus]